PLDKRSVQFRGVLGGTQRLFESPRGADQRSSLDLDDAIVPTGLDSPGRTDTLTPKCDGQLSCRNRIRQWRSRGHVQDSFGWLSLEREQACFGSFVSLRQSQAKAETRRQSR